LESYKKINHYINFKAEDLKLDDQKSEHNFSKSTLYSDKIFKDLLEGLNNFDPNIKEKNSIDTKNIKMELGLYDTEPTFTNKYNNIPKFNSFVTLLKENKLDPFIFYDDSKIKLI
jgi:hypothetical protein